MRDEDKRNKNHCSTQQQRRWKPPVALNKTAVTEPLVQTAQPNNVSSSLTYLFITDQLLLYQLLPPLVKEEIMRGERRDHKMRKRRRRSYYHSLKRTFDCRV
jgi:hypothetical protein